MTKYGRDIIPQYRGSRKFRKRVEVVTRERPKWLARVLGKKVKRTVTEK